VLTLMPMLTRGRTFSSALVRDIMDRFFQDEDRSGYGLINAITSLARDSDDPDTKWRLEELGGGIPALLRPSYPDKPRAALRAFARPRARRREPALSC
jgi:hypothetical protein